MPDREQILGRIQNLEDSFVSNLRNREYADDEVWLGEEHGARFEVTKDSVIDAVLVTIRGRSLKGRRRLLEDFTSVLGEPTLPGNGLPRQHLFVWSKDPRLEKLSNLVAAI